MQLFDTHTHVNFQPFQDTYREVLERALEAGVLINNVGSQWESSKRSVEIADEFTERGINGIWASVGVHPIHLFKDIVEEQEIDGKVQTIRTRAEQFNYKKYKQLVESSDNVIAIGECGIDYLHFERAQLQDQREALKQLQLQTLRQHCQLAVELNLPVVIHCRDAERHTNDTTEAFADLVELLREFEGSVRGVVHCYTGTPKYIPQFLELGLYIGFTGIVTFPNATEVRDSMLEVPLDRILLETDAPYLAPVPHRGKRNEPLYVKHVAESIAEQRNVDILEVAQRTTANALELFRLG